MGGGPPQRVHSVWQAVCRQQLQAGPRRQRTLPPFLCLPATHMRAQPSPPLRPPSTHITYLSHPGPCSSQVLSWVFSPLLAGFFAIVLFFFTRLIVLRSPRAYERSIYMLPIFVFATFYLCTWFM